MANQEQDKLIKDAQYRKGLSIAYFNAVNSAVAILQAVGVENIVPKQKVSKGKKAKKLDRDALVKGFITNYVLHFLAQHKEYYAEVIAQVGAANYKPEESIEKLMKTTNYEDLSTAWRLLSADERKDPAIIKVAQELKKQFNEKA